MRVLFLLLSLLMLLTGCTQQSSPQSKTQSAAEDPLCNPAPVRFFHLEQKAKKITEAVDGVDRAVVVHIDDELDIAVEVSNFNRLRLQEIEKEVAKRLKAAFSQAKIHVTSDKKLIDELQKLSEQPWSAKQADACKQKKQLKQIEKRMRG